MNQRPSRTTSPKILCHLDHVSYAYPTSVRESKKGISVFKNVSFQIKAGEQIVLKGASGSGKSTLLHLIGLLDQPTTGEIYIEGQATQNMKDAAKTALRRNALGLIYQFHHLLPELTAIENVAFPLVVQKQSWAMAKKKAAAVLKQVGLLHRLDHKPAELSGGEQQRVAIARALVHKPRLLLADEPTGSLDAENSARVIELLQTLSQETGCALLIATHNTALINKGRRVLSLENGGLYDAAAAAHK